MDGADPDPVSPESALPDPAGSTDSAGSLVPAANASAASATPATPAAVLAHGHLHPAILLLQLFTVLRGLFLPVLLGILVAPWFLALAGLLLLLQMATALLRYVTLEYTLTEDELRVREGLLHRQERRIPLDRVQDLGFESSLLRRALGLVVVQVETASGQGVEVRLDALGVAAAEHLRAVLLAARDRAAGAPGAAATAPLPVLAAAPPRPPQWLVHRTSATWLWWRGVTDLRLSAFLVLGFSALELADRIGLRGSVRGVVRGASDWLGRLPPGLLAAMLVLALTVVLGFGIVTSTCSTFVQFFGFELWLSGDVLQRRYGLLTTRQKVLPRARIQRVTLEQPWLRWLAGWAVVKADSAGGSRAEGEDQAGGFDVVVPLAEVGAARLLLPALLPGFEREVLAYRSGSPRLVLRTALQGVVVAALLAALLVPGLGAAGWLAFALVPVAALLGVLVYRKLGYALGEAHVALRHGVFGLFHSFVPTAKVQAVVVRQGPLEQCLGVAALTVHVAGGSSTTLPHLLLADARELAAALAERAAVAAAADW
jgi:putative membrane protein